MLKKNKNIAVGILILITTLIIVWNPNERKETTKPTLRYWYVSGNKDDIPYNVKIFNELQDSVFVEATPIPWNEHEKKILTSILSENPPDVVMLVSTVPKWAARKALVNLDKAIEKDNFDSSIFYKALWKEMFYNNSVYAIPCYTASYALFYNKKIFREAGLNPNNPPKTWKQVKEYSEKINQISGGKIKRMGFIPHYGTLQTSFIMALELNAKFRATDNEKVNLTSEEIIESFNEELKLVEDISLEDINAFMAGFGYGTQQGFINEKLGMMILDNTFIDQIALYNPDLDYGVAEIPTFEGGETKSSTGAWWYAIPRGAKNKNAAWDFIKFSVSAECQLQESLNMDISLFPANTKAATSSEFLSKNPYMKIFDKQMQNTETKVIFPLIHDVFWREYSLAREQILYKVKTPLDALKEAEKTIQSNLDRAIEYDNYVRTEMKSEEF